MFRNMWCLSNHRCIAQPLKLASCLDTSLNVFSSRRSLHLLLACFLCLATRFYLLFCLVFSLHSPSSFVWRLCFTGLVLCDAGDITYPWYWGFHPSCLRGAFLPNYQGCFPLSSAAVLQLLLMLFTDLWDNQGQALCKTAFLQRVYRGLWSSTFTHSKYVLTGPM